MKHTSLLPSRDVLLKAGPRVDRDTQVAAGREWQSTDGEAAGGEEFLRELYTDHSPALMYFAMRLTAGDRHSAEDVVQETMIRAWRNTGELRESGLPVRPWLFTVARRLVIDAKRRRDVRPYEVGYSLATDASFEVDFEAVHTRDEVIRVLKSLVPEQREVIVCVHLLGMSVAETSQALGIPPGTVKSRTHYILRALRCRLLAEASAA